MTTETQTAVVDTTEIFPGATVMEIASLMMQDIVGDYETPSEVPEWAWVERVACYNHAQNGQHGIWEFVINLSCDLSDVPERLAPAITEARQKNFGYIVIHQGT